jgi:Tfp pilus assembly protein PilX
MKIMITIAEREAREASKKAEADLRNKENQLRNVDREDEAPEMNPEIRKQVDRFLGRSRDANGG